MNHFRQNTGSIQMEGGYPLHGSLKIQGSKNSVLPIMAACILIPDCCVLNGSPDITDVMYMNRLLAGIGTDVKCINTYDGLKIQINAKKICDYRLPEKYVCAMRSSVILIGPLLGRVGEICINYPGGCVLGSRPIDLHLYALEKLGAQIWIEGKFIHAYADELVGAEIAFPFPSVGATENAILAAVTAKGTTVIKNAAREPEILELCNFLNKAGADIELSEEFMRRGRILIHGVDASRLHGISYNIVADRIVAGTYLFAALATGGMISLENSPIEHMDSTLSVIKQMGGKLTVNRNDNIITLDAVERSGLKNMDIIETDIYPAFPTDLQSPLMSAACVLNGNLEIKEKIFSSRFKIVSELQRMGARISIKEPNIASIEGGAHLVGRNVIARELRGGAALIIAGLAAEGITTVSNVGYINRGYQNIARDFSKLGAKIKSEKSTK